jgi:GT2 family glycosyltransferase
MESKVSHMVDLSVIIVSTNEKDFAYKCLESIRKSRITYMMETIFVDNASSDGTSAMVKEKFPEAVLIINDKKMGYIRNNIMATKMAKGRYVLLLNSDIEVLPDTIQYMLDFMEKNPRAAVSGCKLVFEDGTLQLTCRQFPTPIIYLNRLPHFFRWMKSAKKFSFSSIVKKYLMLDYDHKTARPVDWLLSAFFLMRRSAMDDLGGLDHTLTQPFYLEDVEWCFRARLSGWLVYYVPEVYAYHYYRRDSVRRFNKLSLVHMSNIMKFFNKHGLAMFLGLHNDRKQEACSEKFVSLWGPVILWAGFIFFLSNIPYLKTGLNYDFILRKCAHISEYFVLTVLLVRALFNSSMIKLSHIYVISFIFSVLYAFSDEFHQTFIPGRHAGVQDVFIDSCGIAIGIIVAHAIHVKRI